MADFHLAIGMVLRHEGGYVSDPDDSGGETKFGISKAAYPHLNIANLSRSEAIDLLYKDFWLPLRCDRMNRQRTALALFDFGVNAGVKRAAMVLQGALGVTVDGSIGPVTLAAVEAADDQKLAMQFTLDRIRFYAGLAAGRTSRRKFLPGWVFRALDAIGAN